ncbi:MAG: hypothetical protein PQJ47_07815 [Sphaerochaetaceae bacterium]|nr:hypothetical protein [Sphaerochaetaceae bacterium]
MKKRLSLFILILVSAISSLSALEPLFVETLPFNGRIPLQESFILEVTFQIPLVLSQDIAGREVQIASYDFFSNSPQIAYNMRLSPGVSTQLGSDVFAFRSITAGGLDTGNDPIPFRLIVRNEQNSQEVTNEDYRSVRKEIGVLVGSRYEEKGLIYVQFPSLNEGFDINDFSTGLYDAIILVEVLAD